MIAKIRGKVADKFENSLIVDVSGVGYEVIVGLADFENASPGSEISLNTHEHIRENSHDLYGFTHPDTKLLFEKLITVNGVGPRMAIAILNVGKEEELRNAIASGHDAFVAQAPGVGKRIAQRIVIDLKDKIGGSVTHSAKVASARDDAYEALVSLGYSPAQAESALAKIDVNLPVEERIKQGLKELS